MSVNLISKNPPQTHPELCLLGGSKFITLPGKISYDREQAISREAVEEYHTSVHMSRYLRLRHRRMVLKQSPFLWPSDWSQESGMAWGKDSRVRCWGQGDTMGDREGQGEGRVHPPGGNYQEGP